jgi:hypothetical protein
VTHAALLDKAQQFVGNVDDCRSKSAEEVREVEIGKPRRIHRVEPLRNPVPKEPAPATPPTKAPPTPKKAPAK